ncbi:TolC family protein [Sulfurimonas sp.]
MKQIILLLLPVFIYAETLQTLLEYANQNNNLIQASSIEEKAKQQELSSQESSYYPTLDATAFYHRDDDATPFNAGTTYGASATLEWSVYDGGKRAANIKQKDAQLHAKKYTTKKTKTDIALSITQDFFTIRSMIALLSAQEDASKAIQTQLERIKSFYEVDLATSDDVDRLQSAYDKSIYEIESLKLKILSTKKKLELKVGKTIHSFDNSFFVKVTQESVELLPAIAALKSSAKSLLHASDAIKSFYYPNVKISDTYTYYGYDNKPTIGGVPIELLYQQNTLQATLNMRLVDFGVLSEQQEALKLQAEALKQQIIYQDKEQKVELDIAKERIKTAKLNIKSTQSAFKSASSALTTITQKYKAGIVDNVVYLDALSNNTSAKALYEQSLNDLEIAYAIYYYYQGKNLQEKLQ